MIRRFSHNGTNYEIQAALFERGWRIQIFRDGAPVSPRYEASTEVAADFSSSGWGSVVNSLMHLAHEDFLRAQAPGRLICAAPR